MAGGAGDRIDVLLLGGGGREHALALSLAKSPMLGRLLIAPGGGWAEQAGTRVSLDPEDPAAVAAFSKAEGVGLVVVGPEAPLAVGVADALANAGIPCFGPSQEAARLESSKAFTKEVCDACSAPTAASVTVESLAEAEAEIRKRGAPIVVKADGLAAGKGVVVAETLDEALDAARAMLEGLHGAAGARLVLEEKMEGEEASLFLLTDGEAVVALASAQDHKRAYDGDQGPNTGGMGAYSPAPVLTAAIEKQAIEEIVKPCLAEMARRGAPYRGVLYAGLMIEHGRARLVEYNVRFGDPEAQVVLPRLASDLLPLLLAAANGPGAGLAEAALDWRPESALTVTIAAKGYPGDYAKGEVIGGLDRAEATEGVTVFRAGTRDEGGQTLSNGGRVLNVTALGADLADARNRAYAAVDALDWPGGFCRRDIGWRALPGS